MFSNAWLTTSFIAASCDGGTCASRSRLGAHLGLEAANGTARLMSPASAASLPDSGLPLSACSFTRVRPEPVDPHAGQVGAPHARVRRADARVLASRSTRSAHSAMSLPPPTHQPCTCAITGFGMRQMLT